MKSFKKTFWTATGLLGLVAICAMPAAADQVINDDLIVTFSACIGNDCVNGESFGFDTLRLKENNLRIHFLDTSNSASFPSNDWRIVINDSSNGGGNYFAIEDSNAGRQPFRLDAGAPANSMRIDSAGDLGLGTSNPVVDLHMVSGNTPTMRMEQDGSSGFTAQTYDVAANEANFFIRDVTNGSRLFFRSKPGAPEDSIFIAADGDIGLGTDAPGAALNLLRSGGVNTAIRIDNNQADAPDGWDMRVNTNGNFQITEVNSGAQEFQINGINGNVTISGNLVTGGGGTCDPGPCDGTFRPEEYTVESIEEHAAYMWENQHLWGVGPTPEGQPLNLSKKTTGILHELEKAHIYIEQLNSRLKSSEEHNATLRSELDELKALVAGLVD